MLAQQPIIDAIKKELGSVFSTEAHTDSDIYRYINSGLNYIASFRDFPFLIKTQTVTYTTPWIAVSIDYCVKTIWVNGDPSIRIISEPDWFFPSLRDSAVCVDGDTFIAASMGTYQIMYVCMPTTVTSTSGDIDIPPQFGPVLTDIAIHYGFKDLKLYDKSGAKIAQANNELALLAQRISNPTPRQKPRLWSNHRI